MSNPSVSIDTVKQLRGATLTNVSEVSVLGYYALGDKPPVTYERDPLDKTSPDNGGVVIVSVDGTRWKIRHADVIHVKWFGAVGNGVSDDTAAGQAAIDYAMSVNPRKPAVYVGSGTFSITKWKLSKNIRLIGDGAILSLRSGLGPILEHSDMENNLYTDQNIISDLTLDGGDFHKDSIGFSSGSPTLIMRNVVTTRCGTGFALVNAQFGTLYSCRGVNNGVTMYLESTTQWGGGNSITFYDFQATGSLVGVVTNRLGPWPQAALLFINPSVLDTKICAFAFFGAENVIVQGSANEATGGDLSLTAPTYSYKGLTIKRASFYLNNSRATLDNGRGEGVTVDPNMILENGSILSMSNMNGFGLPFGHFASCDETSVLLLQNDFGPIGSTDYAASFPSTLSSQGCAIVGTPDIRPSVFPLNECANSDYGDIADTSGTVNSGPSTGTGMANYFSAQFAADASAPGRIRFNTPITAPNPAIAISFLMYSSVSESFLLGGCFDEGNQTIFIPGGRWTRVFWCTRQLPVGNPGMVLQPRSGKGVSIKFSHFMQVSGTDGVETKDRINAVLRGNFTPYVKP